MRASIPIQGPNNDTSSDTTTLNITNTEATALPGWMVFTVFKTIVIILGLLTNITTFLSLTMNSEGFPQISRILLQHQAIADSFVCIMAIGIFTQNFMWMTSNHTFNFVLCQAWHGQAVYWGGVLLSVWNIVFITVERFMLINFPFQHRNIRPTHVYIVFALMYVLSVIFLGPAYVQVKYDKNSTRCLNEFYFPSESFGSFMSYFSIFWFFIVYAVPVAIFIGLYSKTLVTLRIRQKKFKEANQESHVLKVADQQLTRTAIAVAVVFVIALSWDSWFYLLGFCKLVEYNFNTPVQIVGVFFATLNSCANPLIYAAFLPCFRRSLAKTFRLRNTTKNTDAMNTEGSKQINQSNRDDNSTLTSLK